MNNICPNCATENEEQYKYCKNCGTQLENEAENRTTNKSSDYSAEYGACYNNYGNRTTGSYTGVPEILGGVPTEDVRLFLGKKADAILPKFASIEITRRNTTWCWPAAVFGFLFGPIGAAFWFFYRKMYKIGTLLAALGVAVLMITSFITVAYGTEMALDSIIPPELQSSLGIAAEDLSYRTSQLAEGIASISNIATAIVCGLFGYYWYFKTAVQKIIRYRSSSADMRYYQFALGALGGTSGGALAAIIVIYVVVQEAIGYLANLI